VGESTQNAVGLADERETAPERSQNTLVSDADTKRGFGPRAVDAPGPEKGQKLTFGMDPYSGAVHQGHVPIGSACARVSGSWQMLLASELEGNP
jgi:hypothetical protein